MSLLVEAKKNPMVYIGSKRRKRIEQLAITLSHLSGNQVSVSNVAQKIIDTYFEEYKEKSISEIKETFSPQLRK